MGFSCCGVCGVVATGGCWPCALELELEAVADSSTGDAEADDAVALVSAAGGAKLGPAGAGVASALGTFAFVGFASLVPAMTGIAVTTKSDSMDSKFLKFSIDGNLLYYGSRTNLGQTMGRHHNLILVVVKRIQTAAPLGTFFVRCLRR
jgi:hypothetical protein